MALPDLSDVEKMALIGRQTVIRKAKREALQKLRDAVVPMLDMGGNTADLRARLLPLIEQIEQADKVLAELC